MGPTGRAQAGCAAGFSQRLGRGWTLAAATATVVAFTAIDIAGDVVVIAGALMGPFLAARVGRRETAVLAALVIAAAIVTAIATDSILDDQRLASTLVAIAGAMVAVWVAGLREAREVNRDRLEATLGSLADGVTVQTRSGEIVYANAVAADLLGFESPAEVVAAGPGAVFERFELFGEDGEPFPLERLPAWRAFSGERAEPVVLRFSDEATGDERWTIVKSTPLTRPAGGIEMAVNIFEDITDLKRAELVQRFLAESGKALTASLDPQWTLKAVARLAVPEFADWCAVDLLGASGIERVAIAHADPERVAFAEDFRRRYPPDPDAPVGPAHVARTGETELYPDVSAGMLEQLAIDDEHLELMRSLGLRSAMIVPIHGRSELLGALTFVNAEHGRAFDDRDLALAEEVGRRAGTAIENARLFGERAQVARTLQESLLPPHLPAVPGLEVAARYQAAGAGIEVGGDFYDVFELGNGTWAAVIGDVCGKGAQAAATTALARYTLRAAAMSERDPRPLLATLNDALLQQRDDRQFCTVAFVSVAPRPGGADLLVACAGHPQPLVLRADGVVETVPAQGTLLGIVPDPELSPAGVGLSPGDALLLYTDGITESRMDGGFVGLDGLVRAAAGAAGGTASELARVVVAAAGDGELRDDVAVVVVRVPDSPPATPAVDVSLPAHAGAAAEARAALAVMDPLLPEERREDLRLLVSEVVTNALRHGDAGSAGSIPFRARVVGRRLRVEVADTGPGFEAPERARPRESGEGGWGLVLVSRLAASWGCDRGPGRGNTVWFELDLA